MAKAAQAAQDEYRRNHPELNYADIEVELPVAPPAPAAPARPQIPVHPHGRAMPMHMMFALPAQGLRFGFGQQRAMQPPDDFVRIQARYITSTR